MGPACSGRQGLSLPPPLPWAGASICPLCPQSLPLTSSSRWLLKRGELLLLEESSIFRKIASRPTCYLFLFSDVLVVTKKKRWATRLPVPG